EGPAGGGSCGNDADGNLTSPPIDLRGVQGPVSLRFNHLVNVEEGYDFTGVSVLADGVETVLARQFWWGRLPVQTEGFEPVSLDLSAFAGRQVQLRFHFQSDSSTTYEGWYVDDVAVSESRPAYVVNLGAGEVRTGLDFGNQRIPQPGAIAGTVWSDR